MVTERTQACRHVSALVLGGSVCRCRPFLVARRSRCWPRGKISVSNTTFTATGWTGVGPGAGSGVGGSVCGTVSALVGLRVLVAVGEALGNEVAMGAVGDVVGVWDGPLVGKFVDAGVGGLVTTGVGGLVKTGVGAPVGWCEGIKVGNCSRSWCGTIQGQALV